MRHSGTLVGDQHTSTGNPATPCVQQGTQHARASAVSRCPFLQRLFLDVSVLQTRDLPCTLYVIYYDTVDFNMLNVL